MAKLVLRQKMFTLLLAFAVIPVLVIYSVSFMVSLEETASHEHASLELNEKIRQHLKYGAAGIAEERIIMQTERYANLISEIFLSDPNKTIEEWKEDSGFQEVATRKFGDTGYTMLYHRNATIFLHPDPKMTGTNLQTTANQSPDFWAVIEAGLDGNNSCGYYDWKEADGFIKQKYVCTAPVRNTILILAQTAPILEFEPSTEELQFEIINQLAGHESELERRRNVFSVISVSLLLLTTGVALILSVFLSNRITQPFGQISQAMKNFKQGKDYELDIRTGDETQELADSFKEMAGELEKFTETLQKEVKRKTGDLGETVERLEETREVMMSLLEDMEENRIRLEKEEELRSGFLRNVSHELKTPGAGGR